MEKNELVDGLSRLISGGMSLEAAERFLGAMQPDAALLKAAIVEYETRVKRIRSLVVPVSLEDDQIGDGWYTGPRDESDVFWPALRTVLLGVGMGQGAVDSVDSASNKIVGYMAPPGATTISTRGLVVGQVQSGKTTNFMAVIAKSADVGYRLVVVLSGIHNSLRLQTQDRLNEQLIDPVSTQWFKLTGEHDFVDTIGNVNFLLADPNKRVIAVVKKNPVRLAALNRWLDGASKETMKVCPILVVDDESDQASVDVGTQERRSKIHSEIIHLLEGHNHRNGDRKAAYVGYTATPFAPLLINPEFAEDLYPRDFIIDLEQPDGHYGAEVIFGREPVTPEDAETPHDGYDMVRIVPEDDVLMVRPPTNRKDRQAWTPDVPKSLVLAIRWFVLATAAREVRRTGIPHSTMLIHTTVSVDGQERTRPPVEAVLQEFRSAIDRNDAAYTSELRSQWHEESERLPSRELGQAPVPFEELEPYLPLVLGRMEVVIDNYRSYDRLHYPHVKDFDDEARRYVIAIGGNTLSRGLTLEGLVTSYFVRTASAYDTLLQMGRWFGYRRGYEDLPRLWMTDQLREWFVWLATVEYEIRLDIRRYRGEHMTPREFAVRIRTHPKMAITSAAKMRHAIAAEVSYSEARLQTILFNHRQEAWLNENIDATRQLIAELLASGKKAEHLDGRWLIADTPPEPITGFLRSYQFHEDAFDLKTDPLVKYISAQNKLGELLTWNVVVMERADAELGTMELGLEREVGLMVRARMDIAQPHANIKALMSKVDRVADLTIARSRVSELDDQALAEMRPPGVGLLLIYPIQHYSAPKKATRGRARRVPLDAIKDVIGVGLVFPKAAAGQLTPQTYMTADLSRLAKEQEEDELEVDEIDAEDARQAEVEAAQSEDRH